MAARVDPMVVSYLALRRLVGVTAMFLPASMIVAGLVYGDICSSISKFYYTGMQDVFVGTLILIGAFLVSYTGYKKAGDEWVSDRTLAFVAGAASIIVALLPTDAKTTATVSLVGTVHLVAAFVFFVCVGLIAFCKFSRTDDAKLAAIYKLLGGIVLGSLAIMVIGVILIDIGVIEKPAWDWVFWMETLAIWAFGISWLIKGNTLEGLKSLGSNLFRN